jgi:RecA-family ATPase
MKKNTPQPTPQDETIYDTYSLTQLRESSFENDTLLHPYIPRVGITAVVGMPDSGKSMLCRNLALAVTFGEEVFLGLPLVARYHRALFVTTEDTVEATKQCFTKMADTYSPKDRASFENNMHILLADDLGPDDILERIEDHLEQAKFDLVIIDAYGDVFRGGEGNSNIQNRNSLRPFSVLSKKHGLAIVFVHHTNKAARNLSPDHIHVQGGSGFVQKVRTVLELRPSKENGSIKFLACTKGNGVADEFKKEALVLEFDTETFRYSATGATKKVIDLKFDIPSKGKSGKIVASELFASDESELSRAEIVKRIVTSYELSEPTAIRWIGENLMSTRHGMYARPE